MAPSLTPNQLRFVEELETTTKTQGIYNLCCNECYCALGIAAELFKTKDTLVETDYWGKRSYDKHNAVAPPYVIEALGLHYSLGSANHPNFRGISQMSDERKSFKEIAEILRANPEAYFKQPQPLDAAQRHHREQEALTGKEYQP
jgi:hypothetical protein